MNLPPKLVSVIIPAYQHQEYIRECIESILAQTYSCLELILIDDSSTDGTFIAAERMRERCEARFIRTVIMPKEKDGVASSCNLGLELARGEYIYFIASDDAALPHAIETLAAVLDADERLARVDGHGHQRSGVCGGRRDLPDSVYRCAEELSRRNE